MITHQLLSSIQFAALENHRIYIQLWRSNPEQMPCRLAPESILVALFDDSGETQSEN